MNAAPTSTAPIAFPVAGTTPMTCTCTRPIPEHIGLFDVVQCRRCWRKICSCQRCQLRNTQQLRMNS